MSIKKMAWLGAVPALLLAASTVAASPKQTEQRCVFEEYAAVSVAPYNAEENVGMGSYTRLKGAQVFVAAQPGLTAEWLTLSVEREMAKLSTSANDCRPRVRGVRVQAVSAGTGFWVMLSAPNEQDAAALLQWARGIVPAGQR